MSQLKGRKAAGILLVVALLTGACSGGGGRDVENVDVVSFVQNEIANTADNRDPVEINQINFLNLETEDDTIYDNLLDR